jgi:hypothetical protein
MSERDDESMDDAPLPVEQDNPEDEDYHSESSQVSQPDEESEHDEDDDNPLFFLEGSPEVRHEFEIRVPTFEELGTLPEDYEKLQLSSNVVDKVLAEDTKRDNQLWYEVEFETGIVRSVCPTRSRNQRS